MTDSTATDATATDSTATDGAADRTVAARTAAARTAAASPAAASPAAASTAAGSTAATSTTAPAGEPVLRLQDATAVLGGRTVWQHVDLTVHAGEFVALLGPNGAGKSTLLRVALGLLPLAAGTVRVLGEPAGRANRRIGYLPQRRTLDAGLPLRGRDLVRLGLDGDRWGPGLPDLLAGRRGQARRRQVDEALALVGATGYADRPLGECSGGEQQRLLIAQALIRRPALLILDEPLDSLDVPNQASVSALIRDVAATAGVAVLLVAHDVNPLIGYLDRVAYLARGCAVQGTPEEIITAETLSALYETPVDVLRDRAGRLVVVGQPDSHPGEHRHPHPVGPPGQRRG